MAQHLQKEGFQLFCFFPNCFMTDLHLLIYITSLAFFETENMVLERWLAKENGVASSIIQAYET